MRVTIDSPQIVHEAIDGEVVIVNFKNGRYYSLENVGAVVWDCLARGMTLPAIVAHLEARYEGDGAAITEGVNTFVTVLLKEGIVVPADDAGAPADSPHPPAPKNGASDRPAFQPPAVTCYNDMEGLLLIDPVNDAGGP
jgi:hypothetical protein